MSKILFVLQQQKMFANLFEACFTDAVVEQAAGFGMGGDIEEDAYEKLLSPIFESLHYLMLPLYISYARIITWILLIIYSIGA